ncbi:hypothetical protein Fmac_013521 [Flemingia macrophylla]|uniref:BHLH domain-containing protein n=1 Tax=Flemingia macrophylla TaxID=520843 RepID=A0ABD1MTC9_9FABA
MEGQAEVDSTMLPLSQIPPSSSSVRPSKRVRKSDRQSLNMERERRSKMAHMFTQLRTTVPGVFPQATREVIINETIGYIKELEKKKRKLEELKESKGAMVGCGNRNNCSITVTVTANVAFFGIQTLARPGLVTLIVKVFYKYQTDILAANVSVHDANLILAITAFLQNGNAVVDNIKTEIMSL